MLKLAILKPSYDEDEKLIGWSPVFEGEDDEFESELIDNVFSVLGGKDTYNQREVETAIRVAFDKYKSNFKEKTTNLP